ncbi:hypothetical protein ACFYOD_32170 [Streptomyces sp. NPDC006703]|uniref:hypothetical protein n=1 Tax=Streptomyces sp. NPDC006703 TaxID=3364759 RepID=UPI0036CB5912
MPIPVRGTARYLEELAGHLAPPQALISGSSLCPPVLLRLAQVLHEGGHPHASRSGWRRFGGL